jgi:SNF2 family DNA or RNA helicase
MGGGKEGAAALEKLRRKLHPFILRRLKKDVAKDLPDKIVRVAYCPMSEEQQRLTNEVRMRAKSARTKFEMLSVLMRMRQIANHPALVSKNVEPDSGKLEAFFDILDEAIGGGHRVLVFSQFVSMLSILRAELGRRNVAHCYLDGSTKDRLGECRRFNQSDIPVFLISLHAGGTGLNLTGADTVIHFDPWWNPAVEDQATDRAHRIGQKKTVCVIKLISEDSVEKRVLELQEKKQSVIDATVGATDEAIVSKMSFDDLKQIAGL